MAKARPRKPPGGPTDGASGGTANGRGEAGTGDTPAEATMAPEVLYLDEKAVYQPEGSQYPGQETDFDQPAYGQPGGAGTASQWPSAGAVGWDGDGTGVWDAAAEWGADDQGEAWDEHDGWDGGAEAGTWQEEEGDEEAWVGPDWSAPGYELGYTTPYLRSRDEALAAYQDYGTLERDTGWTREVRRGPRPQPSRGNGPWPELVMIAAVAVIIAAVILAVTSADRSPGTGPRLASQHCRR